MTLEGEKSILLTEVYAFNNMTQRKAVWNDLVSLGPAVSGPWAMMGDFNIICYLHEKESTVPSCRESLDDFNGMVGYTNMVDLKWKAEFYRWCDNQSGDRRVKSRIDRAMANPDWCAKFIDAEVKIGKREIPCHSLLLIKLLESKNFGPKPFWFLSYRSERHYQGNVAETS